MRVTPVVYKLEQSVMGQKMCFGDRYVFFRGADKKFINFHYFFRKKTRNSLFSQCKTSIGNNSGSIKEKKSMLKTYQFITQCKGVICHPFKTAKSIVFDPMKYKSQNVPL